MDAGLFTNIFLGLIALGGIILGAESVVWGAKRLARKAGLSEFFIGLTLISVLTSLPEIIEHIVASIGILRKPAERGVLSGLAIGTNVGSNIIQITLIIGVVGLFGKLICDNKFLKQDYIFMLFSIVLLWLFSLNGISRIEGLALAGLYILYLAYKTHGERLFEKMSPRSRVKPPWIELFCIAIGFSLLSFCANFVLQLAADLSETYHISGSLIGALVIGVATALPEFSTALTALIRKSSGLSLGTLVGSNITNPLLALGLGAAISGYTLGPALLWFDIPFWLGISILGFFLFWKGKYLSKPQAVILVLSYLTYIILRLRLFL